MAISTTIRSSITRTTRKRLPLFATSGDVLDLVEVRVNCEQNSLLYRVRPRGGVCHTQDDEGETRAACYYRRLTPEGDALEPA